MSQETLQDLNTNTLIGFTDKRGNAWHYRADLQGDEPNHYPGPVPVGDVHRRLFDWTADSRPLYVALPTDIDTATTVLDDGSPGRFDVVDGRQAIVRSDTGAVLGIFKSGYQAHQYAQWLVENVESIIGGDLGIASAGTLKGGAVAWVQVEVPESVETPEGFTFRPYLCATTSFDGSLATTYKRGATAVVCDNTLAMALDGDGELVKVKHTRYSNLRIADAREALSIVEKTADDFAAEVARLANWKVTTRDFDLFLDGICPVDETAKTSRSITLAADKRDALVRLYTHDDRCAPWNGTALGVLQAVNTWQHHEQTVRGSSRADRNALNAITGATAKADAATLDLLATITPAPELATV